MAPPRNSGGRADRRGPSRSGGGRGGGPSRGGGGARSSGGGGARIGGGGARSSSGGGPSRGGGRGGGSPRGAASRTPAGSGAERDLGGTQVEGRHAVRELLLAGRRRVREVWILAADDAGGSRQELDELAELARDLKVKVVEVSRGRLAAAARTEAPQGVLATAAPLEDVELSRLARPGPPPPFLLAMDGVTDPGNLGAVIRTAECAGVTGIVLPRHRAVHVTPAVTKAAAGAVEYVPMALVGGLPTAIERLRAEGVWVVGLDAGGERRLDQLGDVVDLRTQGVCLVLGAEGRGLSRLVRQRCDAVVSIPLRGRLASLNVATSAALAMYEVVRHRP